jgi:gluconolactonase
MLIEVVADGLGFTEGPAWLPDGRVACTSISHGCVYVVDAAGGTVERIDTGGGPNGLAVASDGSLYVAQNGGVFDASGPATAGVQVIRDGKVDYLADGMGAPNDLVVGPDGRLWVTDPRGHVDAGRPDTKVPGSVWAVDVESGGKEVVVSDGPVFVNGLGFSRDGSRLFVTATLAAQLLSYDVSDRGAGVAAEPRVEHVFGSGWPDGMFVSPRAECWVAMTAADRLDVITTTGQRAGEIALPPGSLPTNVCRSGGAPDEIFVTAAHSESLLRIHLGDGDPRP